MYIIIFKPEGGNILLYSIHCPRKKKKKKKQHSSLRVHHCLCGLKLMATFQFLYLSFSVKLYTCAFVDFI